MDKPVLPTPLAADARFKALSEIVWDLFDETNLNPLLVYLVDLVDTDLLDVLGEQFHMSNHGAWSLATNDDQKRELIKRSITLHSKKGTPYSIKEALKAVGYNDINIQEGLPQKRYNGAESYSGSTYYDSYGWAEFRLTADVGDTQPISADRTAKIIKTVNEWKPARCKLVDLQYTASNTDDVDINEKITTALDLVADDTHKWGLTYDGEIVHNQGKLHVYNGGDNHAGVYQHQAWSRIPGAVEYSAQREQYFMSGSIAITDRQAKHSTFNGSFVHNESIDFGASSPVAQDEPMQILLTKHRRYNGRIRHAEHIFSGHASYAGAIKHIGGLPYTGDTVTYLDA